MTHVWGGGCTHPYLSADPPPYTHTFIQIETHITTLRTNPQTHSHTYIHKKIGGPPARVQGIRARPLPRSGQRRPGPDLQGTSSPPPFPPLPVPLRCPTRDGNLTLPCRSHTQLQFFLIPSHSLTKYSIGVAAHRGAQALARVLAALVGALPAGGTVAKGALCVRWVWGRGVEKACMPQPA